MNKLSLAFLLLIVLVISGCLGSDDEEEIGPEWRFDKVTFVLDGSEILVMEVPNVKIRMTDSTYSYFRNSASFTGEWRVNEDQTTISGAFEDQLFEHVLISRSARAIVFQASLIDLMQNSTTNAERLTLQLLSQQLIADGKSLNEILNQGQSLAVHYTLVNI